MSEGLKRTLYERFLHFAHLTEQMFTAESSEFTDLAQLHGITAIPSNLTSVHVIDCIGNNEPINNTSIAEKMNLSKASISKISHKLLQQGFIKRSQMIDNKKEVYFTLSPKGKKIFELHVTMHKLIEERFITVLNSLSESEIQATLKFFQVMIEKRDDMVKGEPSD
ncbi:MarR family transcriptional regulator [Paenibacillus cymbidii]|uniref:MarR family transcriptional regulator n=1 Tax=Paenibacillus cymbidii TaxID=1639034 RepID=UPI001A9A77FE|nr:MarR family transcriptional regulator [Paenibacillus cymbidii]